MTLSTQSSSLNRPHPSLRAQRGNPDAPNRHRLIMKSGSDNFRSNAPPPLAGEGRGRGCFAYMKRIKAKGIEVIATAVIARRQSRRGNPAFFLTGPLESTNRPYALAKIAGIEMCHAYNRQYGTKWLAAMPTNLYGPGDTYDLDNSHVIPALIRKFHEAKLRGDKEVVVWGTGTPKREFLYSEDMANAWH